MVSFRSILATLLALTVPTLTAPTSDHVKRVISGRYIFTSFTNAAQNELFVWSSDDAVNFYKWEGPAFVPPAGLLRDPSWFLNPADWQYYVAYTTDWNGANFGIAKSADMLTWNFVANVSTSTGGMIPINTWAPEFFSDPQTGKVNIVVSLSTGMDGPFRPYVFTALDGTLKNWSAPTVMDGIPDAGLGYIDSFPIFFNNQYHLFTKSETSSKFIEHAVAPSLTGPYTFVQTGNFAGWGQAEGPSVVPGPNGGFRLYADGFNSGKYIYSDSKDLFNWTAPKTLPDGLSGYVRHGTVRQQY